MWNCYLEDSFFKILVKALLTNLSSTYSCKTLFSTLIYKQRETVIHFYESTFIRKVELILWRPPREDSKNVLIGITS